MRIIIIQLIDEQRTFALEESVLKNTSQVLSLLAQCQICKNDIVCIYSDFMFGWGRKIFLQVKVTETSSG